MRNGVAKLFAGTSGLLLATAAIGRSWHPLGTFDLFYQDKYFVIANSNVFLLAGIWFGCLAIINVLHPVVTGLVLGRGLAIVHFWVTLACTCVILTATTGMATAPSSPSIWEGLSFSLLLAVVACAATQLLFAANLVMSILRK